VRSIPFTIAFLFFATVGHAQNTLPKTGNENMPPNTIKEYKWWNLLHYTIDITPDYNGKYVKGKNIIKFQALEKGNMMRIDLDKPMSITSIKWRGAALAIKRNGDFYVITFPRSINKGETETVDINFEGHPHAAVKPPWDSGWIWAIDKKGRPWISVACEGSGASIWLPCKNVGYDEPDSGVVFSISVADTLVAIANGRLQNKIVNKNKTSTYVWNVVNPINAYDIIPYVGKYVTWHEDFAGLKGKLDCDYWILDYNLNRAKQHLKQADTMLRCFEWWLGPFPFYEDSYKVVEAPMPGMEHQSAIAYGNNFQNGYSGKNLSQTKWGLKWDFILVHESGHEWFGNSITASTEGESWIHEGFTKYLETLFTAHLFGNAAGNDYSIGIWKRIKNDGPVLGASLSDSYNKSSAMLHMLRQIVGDSIFRGMLRGLCSNFYHCTVSTGQILDFINHYTGHDFTKVFDQYLKTTNVPVLNYAVKNNRLEYRWSNCVAGFNMPVKISLNSRTYQLIYPTTEWKHLAISNLDHDMIVDRNFYIKISPQK
jgi:aminopeptidase N